MDRSRLQSGADPAAERRAAARTVLAGDGRSWVLHPWQIAYLIDVAEGRDGVVPPGCGVGKGWLDDRLREAIRQDPD